jgi:hypothetical protein
MVQVRWSGMGETDKAVRVTGWNFPALQID